MNIKKIMIYFKTCLKLQTRQYISIFFSLFFPIILTIVFVSGVGNNGEIDGFKFINKYFFIATTLSIIASTVLSIPLSFNFDIKLGYLKQLKLLDVNIFLFKLIDIIVSILIIYFEILILFFFSKFIYNLDITSINNVILSLLLLLPTIISYAFLFTIIALFLKKPENYMSIGITSMMILLAFSGCLGIDPNNFGGILTNIYKYIPSYYISIPLYDLWNNGTFPYIDYFISCLSCFILGISIYIILYYIKLNNK